MDNKYLDRDVQYLGRILDGTEEPSNLPFPVLKYITNDFSAEQVIGRGGSAVVYKGMLRKGIIAVKRISITTTVKDEEFNREANILLKIKHHNVVRFLGYCSNVEHTFIQMEQKVVRVEKHERLLCSEYVSKGSLTKHLTDELRGLEWSDRYQIIKGICNGLYYLHEKMRIVHRDLKPGNILLDDSMVPKIADFGISKLLDGVSQANTTTRILTNGYCAPEFLRSGVVSYRTDIYSLGIIIIELVTGSSQYDLNVTNVLRRWRHRWNKSSTEPVEYQQVLKCIEIGQRCRDQIPRNRPSISEIINNLRELDRANDQESNTHQSAIRQIRHVRDLLGIEPLELHFPFEPNKRLSCSLELTNETDNYIAFKINTVNNNLSYCIEPKKGIIPPWLKCSVSIQMEAQEKVPGDKQRNNEFVVQSTSVNETVTYDDINEDIFNEEKTCNIVDDVELTAVFNAPENSAPEVCPGKLRVYPLELCFPFQPNKNIPCKIQLTNDVDEHVALHLHEKDWGEPCVKNLFGVVGPKSSCTLVVQSYKRAEPKPEFDLILQSTVVRGESIQLIQRQYEANELFTKAERRGKLYNVTLRASCGPHQHTASEMVLPGIQILPMVELPEYSSLYSFDTDSTKQWAIIFDSRGHVRIWNYKAQKTVDYFKVSKKYAGHYNKFVARKQWIVSARFSDGLIRVYNYEAKMETIASFKASNGTIIGLAIHPTEPYLLSVDGLNVIKLWNWEKEWECTQAFGEHSSLISEVAFNPKDINIFASASNDRTVKVWSFISPHSLFTLSGHSDKVRCLAFFMRGDQQCLISGSEDKTAKIWDLQKKICVEELKAFIFPVASVSAHPYLPLIMTGSSDGTVHMWNSSDFRLEKTIITGFGGYIIGFECLLGSRRVIIGQMKAVSLLSIDQEFMRSNELHLCEDTANADTVSETRPVPQQLLDIHPSQLCFPFEPRKNSHCSLLLTNNTDQRVAFIFLEKGNSWLSGGIADLPLGGIVPPKSTYTLVVTTHSTFGSEAMPRKVIDVAIQSTILGDQHIHPFQDKYEFGEFFREVKDAGIVLHEVLLKAIYVLPGEATLPEGTSSGMKMSYNYFEHRLNDLVSIDVDSTASWIITGHSGGKVHIMDSDSQELVDELNVSSGKVYSPKFVARKQWFVAASEKGSIHVHTYKTKVERRWSFKANRSFITSLAVHPTLPYLLSAGDGCPIKLWDWDKDWTCTQTFDGHSSLVRQVEFNPKDTDSFVSASDDHTVKVWSLASPTPVYTLSGHSDKVNCLAYFTNGDQQFLISGSNDQTAKIWDLQEKVCVQTLKAFVSGITSVCAHPNLAVPMLITGSPDGVVHMWSSTTFRLERVINLGYGPLVGLGCSMGSGSYRILIAQERFSVYTYDASTDFGMNCRNGFVGDKVVLIEMNSCDEPVTSQGCGEKSDTMGP